MSPVLAGGFLSIAPPGKSLKWNFLQLMRNLFWNIAWKQWATLLQWSRLCFLMSDFKLEVCVCVCVCVSERSVVNLCLTLCNPLDGSPPGSSVFGICQARILEWVAIPWRRESFPPKDWEDPTVVRSHLHWQVVCLPLSHQGSPATHNSDQDCLMISYSNSWKSQQWKPFFITWDKRRKKYSSNCSAVSRVVIKRN